VSGLENEFWATTGSGIAYTNTTGQTWVNASPGYWGIVPLWAVSISPVATQVNGWAVGESGIILHYQRRSSSVTQDAKSRLTGFALMQNYPNPFNPSTIIQFTIPHSQLTILQVFDVLGREVATLVNENLNAGSYETTFDASGLASGIYFYRLTSDAQSLTKKLTLIR
jgi:hypothetical protein